MRRWVIVALVLLAGCHFAVPPPPPPPVLYGPYQLTWDAYPVPNCNGAPAGIAYCSTSLTLTGPGLAVTLAPSDVNYVIGTIPAGMYTYTIYATGRDMWGNLLTSPLAVANFIVTPGAIAATLKLDTIHGNTQFINRNNPQLFESADDIPYKPVPCVENGLPLLERSLPPADIAYAPFWLPLDPYEREWLVRERDYYKTLRDVRSQCYTQGLTALLEAKPQ